MRKKLPSRTHFVLVHSHKNKVYLDFFVTKYITWPFFSPLEILNSLKITFFPIRLILQCTNVWHQRNEDAQQELQKHQISGVHVL